MKFKNLVVSVFAVSTVFSSAAFASGKNLVSCGWNGNDDSVTIREDAGGELVALFSMIDHGTETYKVEEITPHAHQMGAGLSYQGQGIDLHVNTDGPVEDGCFKATLSIPSLGVKDEVFDCKIGR